MAANIDFNLDTINRMEKKQNNRKLKQQGRKEIDVLFPWQFIHFNAFTAIIEIKMERKAEASAALENRQQ